MKNERDQKKLENLLQGEQFSERENLTDTMIKQIEKFRHKELFAMKKR